MRTGKKIFLLILLLGLSALIPVTSVSAETERMLILGGQPFGLKLFTNGVLVVNITDGSPAEKAGIEENDLITGANGEEITSNEQLKSIVTASQGADIEFSLERDKSPISLTVTPETGFDGAYSIGVWVRDSTAGIGTITYFDESTMSFGALGHGICDKDTGMLLPLQRGEILPAEISSVVKAQHGVAGGLNGFMGDEPVGEITVNNAFGIYGRCLEMPRGERISYAEDDEIERGAASIFSTVDGDGMQEYAVEIESLDLGDISGHNMILKVVDERLMEKTGGIIQGMSGSPIVQHGKIIGAVTHVFVNTPEKGYGISISNMLKNY